MICIRENICSFDIGIIFNINLYLLYMYRYMRLFILSEIYVIGILGSNEMVLLFGENFNK